MVGRTPQTPSTALPPSHRSLAARPPSVARAGASGLLRPMSTTRSTLRPARAEGDSTNTGSDAAAPTSGDADAARAAVLARIAKAKQYAKSGGGDASPAAAAATPQQPQQQQPPSWMVAAGGGGDDFASSAGGGSGAPTALPLPFSSEGPAEEAPRPQPRRADFYTAEGDAAPALPDLLAATPARLDGGSADRPANWLAGVLGEGGGGDGASAAPSSFDGSAMRPEAFTAAREALMQRRGAEIITADPSYDPGFIPPPPSEDLGGDAADAVRELERQQQEQQQRRGGEQDSSSSSSGYRPKVSTWGVFERPSDISAAYGGGRTLKPGQALETPEQKEARDKQYKEALAAYRKKAGLEDVTPQQEAAARAVVERADVLFKAGKLREAASVYEEARQMIPLRTTLGGRATLGAAVCLDSLGRGEAARDLYKRLRGHPDAETARTAKRLTFGFDAAKFLKADTITYARGNKEYAKYFRRFADANRIYAASEEELERDRAAARKAALIAVGVMAAPVAGVLALVAGGR